MRMHEWRVRGCIAGKKDKPPEDMCVFACSPLSIAIANPQNTIILALQILKILVDAGIANGVQNHSGSLNVEFRANSPRDLCVPYCRNQYSHVVHQRSLGKHCKVIEAGSRAGLFTWTFPQEPALCDCHVLVWRRW